MPNEPHPPAHATDPAGATQALELELMRQRARREQAKARRRTWRALSFVFLLLVLLGALVACFHFLPELTQARARRPASPSAEADR
jgi:hypothetical protein